MSNISTPSVANAKRSATYVNEIENLRRVAASDKLRRVETLVPNLLDPSAGYARGKLIVGELRSAVDGVVPVNFEVLNGIAKGLHSTSLTVRKRSVDLLIGIIGDTESSMKEGDRQMFVMLGNSAVKLLAETAGEHTRDLGRLNTLLFAKKARARLRRAKSQEAQPKSRKAVLKAEDAKALNTMSVQLCSDSTVDQKSAIAQLTEMLETADHSAKSQFKIEMAINLTSHAVNRILDQIVEANRDRKNLEGALAFTKTLLPARKPNPGEIRIRPSP